jgi:MFS family permease
MGGGLFGFCVISVFLGLGFTFYSGAVEAWLVDALRATDYTEELDHVFARGSQVTGAAMLIGSVSGGVIGTFDLSLSYVVRAILLAVVFVIAFYSMHDLGYEKRALHLAAIPQEMRRLARDSVKYGWQEPQIRILMMVSFVQSGFMIFAFYAWQPYFLDLLGDPDAIWVAGVISALMSIAMIVGNTFTDRQTHRAGKRTTLMIVSMSVFSVCMLGVGLTNSFWIAAPLFLLAMGTTGVAGPVRQSYIHHIIPSDQRASVLSVDSMFSSGGGILFQTGLGQIAQNRGIGEGYIIGSAATFVCAPLILVLRRMGHEADIIKGDAGLQGGFAAQGRPEVTGVDAKPQSTQEVKAVSAD